tara:strand:- start:291 stop:602 length:312 start_codon:yes stop_codon:yes gene_type:complete
VAQPPVSFFEFCVYNRYITNNNFKIMNKTDLIKKLDRKYNWISAGPGCSLWKSTVFNQQELNDIATGVFMQIAYLEYKGETYILDELIEIATNERNLNPINYL